METTDFNNNDVLQFLLKQGNLSVSDVLSQVKEMKKSEILKRHKKTYKIWKADDGRHKTKLPDGSKYGKLVAKSTLADLENLIVEFYDKTEHNTLEDLYPKWIEYKRKESTIANANKLQWSWDKYYKGHPITRINIKKIKTIVVKEFLLEVIEKNNLTRKKYLGVKTVINSMLDYAVELERVQINVARNVRNINRHKYTPERKKDVTEQIYIAEDKEKIMDLAMQQYAKTGNMAYLALCMNFYLGLRVGELVALKKSDFFNGCVSIVRSEVKRYKVVDGRTCRQGFEVVDWAKTDKGIREIVCVPKAYYYYEMIVEENERRGNSGEYLLYDKNGHRMHDHNINKALRIINKKVDTPQKGNHGIRKTCISNMAASELLTNEEIMDFAGHTNYQTTKTYYIFSETTPEERKAAYAMALGV